MVITGAFLMPVAEHHFTLQATKRMFMAKSSDPNLFQNSTKGYCDLDNNKKMIKYVDENVLEQFTN